MANFGYSFNGESTQIHPDKLQAYRATDFRIDHTPQVIVLSIGYRSEPLSDLFAGKEVNCGAFITAYNPRGAVQPDSANAKAHIELATKLQGLGLRAVEGSGSEKGSKWPAEKSYFAFGLTLEPAKAIGTHFNQDAIVWVGEDAIPQLILLR
jgi:hypothetical protein